VVESYVAGSPAGVPPCSGLPENAERMTTEQVDSGRTADRGSSTRALLLAAARQVFMHEGYAEAGITDIVAVAGASVGSLYHHFSGKADLYLALFEQLHNEYDIGTRKAVRECRDRGVTDPMQLLLAGARGYLDVCIEQRDLASLFVRGDGPPGFEVLWRHRVLDWVSRNTEFFARSGDPLDEAAAIVMTGAMMLAVAEVALAPDVAKARQMADSVLEVLSRLRATPVQGQERGRRRAR
jgi:AcrR family transcriptional regulator